MREEKDHFEAALQEERERKMLAESNLAKEQMKQEETNEKEKQWSSAEQGENSVLNSEAEAECSI